jgi:hypothetical protein
MARICEICGTVESEETRFEEDEESMVNADLLFVCEECRLSLMGQRE